MTGERGALWRWLPPPTAPDATPESASLAVQGNGCRVAAARIRGKQHRHNAVFCEDWFEAAAAGPWTIIAVADGAGSRPLSRVGARASCQAAIRSLTERLGNAGDGALADVLEAAARDARRAVEAAWAERQGDTVGDGQRPLVLGDFGATLLLAAYRPGCLGALQIGDGAILAAAPDDSVRAVTVPEGGDYAGETEFLTDADHLPPPVLDRAPIRHLLLTTDGIADIFLPAETGGQRLLAELRLNGVIGGDTAGGEAPVTIETIAGPEGERAIPVRYLAAYAEALGMPVESLAARSDLLNAGRRSDSTPPEVCLLEWLEGFTVRGAFDDRTLVLLTAVQP